MPPSAAQYQADHQHPHGEAKVQGGEGRRQGDIGETGQAPKDAMAPIAQTAGQLADHQQQQGEPDRANDMGGDVVKLPRQALARRPAVAVIMAVAVIGGGAF